MAQFPGFFADEMFRAAMGYRPFAYHAHDLSTAYAALAASRITGAHLVVDFHEWSSENVHWDTALNSWALYPKHWKLFLQSLEARCLKEASATITVCDSIADAMASELGEGVHPSVIRNIPYLNFNSTDDYPPLKRQLGVPDEHFLLLYQGGLGEHRKLEPVIDAVALAPRCSLAIRGPAIEVFGDGYRSRAERNGVSDRVFLLPPVPSKDVVPAARGADAGIYTVSNLCRNWVQALPNKVFEYLASGLPILVADYPEVRKIAVELNTGLTFDPGDPHSIAASINRLIDEPALTLDFRKSVPRALARLDAEQEWLKLSKLYDALPRSEDIE